jgi:hypothetical protein
MHTFGLINYALQYRALYPYPPEWPQTPNFTISLMYHHLYTMLSRPNCPRSPELNETSDGSPKEYKNALYLAFAALKVLIGWFECTHHYFLGPGHSHDEQDSIWKTLKNGFYQSRVTTFPKFVACCQRSFTTAKPEIITKFAVFDWETWLRPWMQLLSQHSKWRAFEFTRSSTNPAAVVMKWKESESDAGDFHGSPQYPNGIELLLEVPPGLPKRIHPANFNIRDVVDICKCFPELTAEEKIYWEEVENELAFPDSELSPVPEDYFDFNKFVYATWYEDHPDSFQQPATMSTSLHNIEVDSSSGLFLISCNIFLNTYCNI